ncbi:glycoside hydrolase family 3 protein, partial [Escherichia coli]|uniref:glycoside hydrolase family 3 protein n=2 Tax=Pseudomonadota TaxID=1224 RepID=UPI0014129053
SALKRELQAVDFAPFKALSDLPLGMSAHIVFEDIAPDGPATTSPTMVRLIREEIGFDGLLMTDDLSMEALSGSVSERARASLAAGCDMIL